jgi:hypothetical protein
MKAVQLFIPGSFEEAWLYMDHLLLLTDDGEILVAPADEIRSKLEEITPASLLSGVALFHSDYIYPTLRYQKVWAGRLREQLHAEVPLLSDVPLEVSLRELQLSHFEIPSGAQSPLDVHIYSRRVYLGSVSGLFNVDVEWGEHATPLNDWRQRVDASCSSITAKYGALMASCGSEGLLTSIEDVYWLAPYGIGRRKLRKVRDTSQRAEWWQSNLINYGFGEIEILRSDRQKLELKGESVQVVRGFAEDAIELSDRIKVARSSVTNENEPTSSVIGNVGGKLLMTDESGALKLLSVSMRRGITGEVGLTEGATIDAVGIEPLGFLGMQDGLLIEHYRGVGHLRDAALTEVISEPVGKVRTFPSSIRYRNVFSAILDDGVLIVGLFDESRL